MLAFDDVYNAPLGKLKAAVNDWSAMVTKLERLAEDSRKTMLANSEKADWEGVNASVTKPFIKKTAKEFDDAAKAAEGIHKILQQGYDAFKKAKDDLRRIVDTDAPAKGLTVGSTGRVTAKNPLSENPLARRDPDYEMLLSSERAAIEAIQKSIDAVIEVCNEADESVSRALKANITDDKHNFSPPKYTSLDAEKAQRAADLAAKGSDLTNTELQQLNELLWDNRKSEVFTTNFYKNLGPEKTLAFFGQMSTDTYDGAKLDKQRLKEIQALQRNLGLTLATATDPDNKTHLPPKWGEELRRLGTERIPLHKHDYSGPYGYQLLGGILRYGNYDPKFLNPIAEHVVQLHQKDPYMFADSKSIGGWQQHPFNPSGKNGAGYDPVISVLEALGHSPEAAKEFFSANPTAYNEDGTVKGGAPDLGKTKDGKTITSYLEYLTNKDYKSFPDIVGHHPDNVQKSTEYMPDVLGHALEAATLGHAYDDPNPQLNRDETTAKIMKEVVRTVGVDAELVKRMEPLADSLGVMGAGYIDDINWALDDNEHDSLFAPQKDLEAHAEFGRSDARRFLSTLGQHPDAYSSVSTAERLYTASMLDAQVGPDGKINQGGARAAVFTGAEVQGMLDQSRADQVVAEGLKKDEEYNKALEKRSAWVKFGTTAAVSAGVAFLPATAAGAGAAAILVPLAVDTTTGAVNEQIGQVIGDWTETKQQDSKDDVQEQKNEIFRAGERTAEAPLKKFKDQHDIDPLSNFYRDLKLEVVAGHNNGKDREDEQGNNPETGD